jgi:F-type H+-transporting ATPase subunit b
MADPVETSQQLPVAEAAEAVHGHEVPAGTSEVAHEGGEGGGLPQFRMEYWGGQIVWLLLIFAVLYVLIAKVFTPRLRKVFDTRAETIATAVAKARLAQDEAAAQAEAGQAQVVQARANALKIAADARAKAKAAASAKEAAEEAKLAARLEEAEASIRAARDAAMGSVNGIAAETVQALVAHLGGGKLTDAQARAAIDAAKA